MTLETTSAPLTKSNLEQLAQQTSARLGRAEDWPIIYNAFASHLGFVTVAEPDLTGSERARMQQAAIDIEDARTGALDRRDAGTGQIHKVPGGGFEPDPSAGFTGEGDGSVRPATQAEIEERARQAREADRQAAGANTVPGQADPFVHSSAETGFAEAGPNRKATMHPDDAGNPVPNDPGDNR